MTWVSSMLAAGLTSSGPLNVAITILATLLVLGALIAFHELGHLLMARLCGVAVEAYSIGFGPKWFARKWGETEYQFRPILIGGFAKIHGMIDESDVMPGEEAPPALFPEHRRFDRKGWVPKVLILAGGPLFNLLLTFVVLVGAGMAGQMAAAGEEAPSRIVSLVADGPGERSGLRAGDILLEVSGEKVTTATDAEIAIRMAGLKPYPVRVLRDGAQVSVEVTPGTEVMPDGTPLGDLGLVFAAPARPVVAAMVLPDSPAEAMGIQAGDRIIAVDGIATTSQEEFLALLKQKGSVEMEFSVLRSGEIFMVQGAPRLDQDNVVRIGISLGTLPERLPFLAACRSAVTTMGDWSLLAYRTLRSLVTGRLGIGAVSGPVGIGTVVGEAAHATAEFGLWPLLMVAAMISHQLAVLNLLPVPALDGGHILVESVEALRRRPFSTLTKVRVTMVGFVLLLSLMAVVLVLDVAKLARRKPPAQAPAASESPVP